MYNTNSAHVNSSRFAPANQLLLNAWKFTHFLVSSRPWWRLLCNFCHGNTSAVLGGIFRNCLKKTTTKTLPYPSRRNDFSSSRVILTRGHNRSLWRVKQRWLYNVHWDQQATCRHAVVTSHRHRQMAAPGEASRIFW